MVLDVATGSNKVKTTVDIAVIYKGNNLEEGLNGLPLHPGQVLIIKGVTPKSSFLRRFILGEKLVYASYVMPKL